MKFCYLAWQASMHECMCVCIQSHKHTCVYTFVYSYIHIHALIYICFTAMYSMYIYLYNMHMQKKHAHKNHTHTPLYIYMPSYIQFTCLLTARVYVLVNSGQAYLRTRGRTSCAHTGPSQGDFNAQPGQSQQYQLQYQWLSHWAACLLQECERTKHGIFPHFNLATSFIYFLSKRNLMLSIYII